TGRGENSFPGHVENLITSFREFRVVRHENGRHSAFAMELGQEVEDAASGFRVEISGRLVGEKETRPARERSGDRDALLLPSRERSRKMGSTIGEPDTIEQLSGPPSRIARGDSGDPMRKRDVLFGRELGKKMVELEHEADPFVAKPRALLRREVVQRNAEDLDAPRIRTVDSAE